MRYEELEKRIRTAADHAAPEMPDRLLDDLPERKGTVIPMTEPRKKNRWLPLAGLAAVLALFIAGGALGWNVWQDRAVVCVVSLDVNPSIALKVNRQERVLSCTPLNADAVQVLFEMDGGADLEGAKLDVAVNALVGALVRHGYLDRISSALLISVEDRDQARADRLQAELTGAVAALLQQESAAAAVYGQSIAQDAALGQMAEANSISAGKAALVNQVLALNGALEFEKLAALSVEELNQLIAVGAPAMPIGLAQARYLAEEYAGTLAVDSVTVSVDPELDEHTPHYEVEIRTHFGESGLLPAFGEFEYKVDAYTGAILSGQPDILTQSGTAITAEQAQDAALAHMLTQNPQLSDRNVYGLVGWLETEHGRAEYHIQFSCGEYWFEYEIDAASGAVLDWEMEAHGPSTVPDPPVQTLDPVPSSSQNVPDTVSSPSPTPSQPAVPAPSPAPSQSPAPAYIGEDAARAAAYAHAGCQAGDVTYVTCKLDRDDQCYEVEFICGNYKYEYEIDCYAGEIREHGCELHYSSSGHHGSSHHHGGAVGQTCIGKSAALAAAYSHAGVSASSASGVKVELDWSDSRTVYEVEFQVGRTEYEYEIDAYTGAVVKYEMDVED